MICPEMHPPMPDTPAETPADTADDMDDLINRIYDVALEPERYEELLDTWDSTVWPKNFDAQVQGQGVLRHFQRADAVLARIEHAPPVDAAEALLQKFPNVAVAVFERTLTVAAINPAARHLLGLSKGDAMMALPIEPGDRVNLTRQVSRMLTDADAVPSIFRVRSSDRDAFIIFQMRRVLLADDRPVIAAVTSDIRWPAGFDGILRNAFGLSGAEIEVTRLLLDCASVREVAEARGRSVDTVRAQIKTILAKTEVHGQVELIRLVLSMMDIAAVTQDEVVAPKAINGGPGGLQPLPFHTVFSDDDRRLDYLVFGDPDGDPILYLGTEFSFVRWHAEAEAEAARRKIKVISPVRAGYGASDPLPRDAPFLHTTTKDILRVLDAEKVVGAVPVVAVGDDNLFAIEAEKQRPGTIRAVIAPGGALPYLNRAQVERMAKWHRFIQAAARYTPHLLPFMVRMAMKLIRRVGLRSFMQTTFSQSDADTRTLALPGVAEALMAGAETAISEDFDGGEAFVRQTLFEQEDGNIAYIHSARDLFPIHFLSGLQDPSMPAETLKEHQMEFDWIDFRFFPDSGQLLLFERWDDVLDLVDAYRGGAKPPASPEPGH